jgi:four helix bundle protein
MKKEENLIVVKSYEFALKIVRIYMVVSRENNEYVLSKQLLRSGTSVGANVEEAEGAQSRADFIHKLSIAYKEARESRYWIRLLNDSKIIGNAEYLTLLQDCEDIIHILSSIILSTKSKKISC